MLKWFISRQLCILLIPLLTPTQILVAKKAASKLLAGNECPPKRRVINYITPWAIYCFVLAVQLVTVGWCDVCVFLLRECKCPKKPRSRRIPQWLAPPTSDCFKRSCLLWVMPPNTSATGVGRTLCQAVSQDAGRMSKRWFRPSSHSSNAHLQYFCIDSYKKKCV